MEGKKTNAGGEREKYYRKEREEKCLRRKRRLEDGTRNARRGILKDGDKWKKSSRVEMITFTTASPSMVSCIFLVVRFVSLSLSSLLLLGYF